MCFIVFSAMGRARGSLRLLFSVFSDFRSYVRPFFGFPIVFFVFPIVFTTVFRFSIVFPVFFCFSRVFSVFSGDVFSRRLGPQRASAEISGTSDQVRAQVLSKGEYKVLDLLYLSIDLSIYRSIYLSFYRSIYLSIYRSIDLIYLS